ncbi:Protein CBR-AQP-12 [Caenorhabditis briggsae]|uniref:Protein CBR-AQP-12 n=1 Tax=Caenorhabditis briggsae TaxID=6238 RepID=A8XYY5_CAEBR|nr:Protein CBR-AQP-12 [Caenorhabditis briggsae]CAP37852.2 Protein CBR-AQP-12 [Caenorhabditis briggsae]
MDDVVEEKNKIARFHNLLIRPNIGEFLGAFFFSFLACFAGQCQRSNGLIYPFLSAFSLYISRSLVLPLTPAHLNPAVTFLHWLRNEVPLAIAVTFCLVQLVGFLFGVSLFRSLVSQTEFNDYVVMYEIVAVDGVRKINRLQGFIQFVSYPLYGFTSNITLLLVTSTVSYIFSPLTTPSFLLLYLNVFASLIAALAAWCLDLLCQRSVEEEE